ncbi:hypothetical protein HYN59_07570 [Flavobacterium album]|uniref:Uncharacterized protein n=1 Tax=Flavobacterium album TaxID=2175091 RepID=A0A2S1QXM8_9FLAO|nr:hypothetical protein [Flavobacterium album]AWH84991.1 hypothetical protein HYN59_07570 [Flavobacterium album]
MKSNLLKIGACLLFVATIAACSSDSDINLTDAATPERANRASFWDGEIGVEKTTGELEITADKSAIIANFEDILQKEGNPTTLTSLVIVKKPALNDPSNVGHMLIGADGRNTSIGVMLIRDGSGSLKLDKLSSEVIKTTSCRGCASGCNLEYLYVNGKKVAICNENGCISDCTKTETEF